MREGLEPALGDWNQRGYCRFMMCAERARVRRDAAPVGVGTIMLPPAHVPANRRAIDVSAQQQACAHPGWV